MVAQSNHTSQGLLAFDQQVLNSAILTAQDTLLSFIQQGGFELDFISTAFGDEVDQDALTGLTEQLSAGDLGSLPSIEVRSSEELQGAKGVYVSAWDAIYISDTFLATATQEQLVAVILEEMGHGFDALLNETDSAGDEGNIFANLVLGYEMTDAQLAALYAEDDSLTLTIDGQTVEAEAASGTYSLSGNTGDVTTYSFTKSDIFDSKYEWQFTNKGGRQLSDNGAYFNPNQADAPGDLLNRTSSNTSSWIWDSEYDYYDYYDEITGGRGDDTILGLKQKNLVHTGDSSQNHLARKSINIHIAETINGGAGNDWIKAYEGNDALNGGTGKDILYGGNGADTLNGGTDSDILYGGNGADTLNGGTGNDLIFTGDLSEGSSDQVTGGSGADTFFIGEVTASNVTTSNFDWASLAWNLAGDISNVAFTTIAPQAALAKAIVPGVIDIVKAIAGDESEGETVADATASTYATVHDFNPIEDVFIVPLASEGDINIDVTSGTSFGKSYLDLTYNNGNGKLARVFYDNSVSASAQNFFEDALLDSAFVIEDGKVTYGGKDDNTIFGNTTLYNQLDQSTKNALGDLSARYMIFGAHGGAYYEDLYSNSDHGLYGTNHGDVLYGYQVETTDVYAPQNDNQDYFYGYGGDDLFYGGGGINYFFGGESIYNNDDYYEPAENGSDTVSYEDANRGITVDLSITSSDHNGTYTLVEGNGFVDDNSNESNDKLYSIENIIGTDFADTITGDGNANILVGGDGNDILNGSGVSSAFSSGTISAHSSFNVEGGGWSSFDQYPRQVADVNGDGRADIVGFGLREVAVALGQEDGTFGASQTAHSSFNVQGGGWSSFDQYPRQVADVNGDGRADIVGFGLREVAVALGQADGTFGASRTAHSGFNVQGGGWSSFDQYPRQVADVNGDGRADLIGFGLREVAVALGQADGTFGTAQTAHSQFNVQNGGWSNFNEYPRQVADVNGDGRADIVGFGDNHTFVALGQADGTFGTAQTTDSSLHNWSSFDRYPRQLADVNGDGRADIVGFGYRQVVVALGQADGNFGALQTAHSSFNVKGGGWSSFDQYPRQVADVNGDGQADIVGFGLREVVVALASGGDTLTGGGGDDTFVLNAESSKIGVTDVITDFNNLTENDQIEIVASSFESYLGMGSGSLGADDFSTTAGSMGSTDGLYLQVEGHNVAFLENVNSFNVADLNVV